MPLTDALPKNLLWHTGVSRSYVPEGIRNVLSDPSRKIGGYIGVLVRKEATKYRRVSKRGLGQNSQAGLPGRDTVCLFGRQMRWHLRPEKPLPEVSHAFISP